MDTTERAAATPVAPVLPGVKEHLVHHDYTWLSAETARSHALHEICKQFNCTEQGAKNAMSRREIPECKDWHHHNGSWKQKETPGGSVKMPAGHPISKIVGKRSFPDGTIQYKVTWADYDDTHATWESPENIQHAKDMVAAFEKSHVE